MVRLWRRSAEGSANRGLVAPSIVACATPNGALARYWSSRIDRSPAIRAGRT